MLIYGAGGHAKVVLSILLAQKENITGVFDDHIGNGRLLNYPIIGAYQPDIFRNERMIITIGDNQTRMEVAWKVKHQFGNAIHPTAWIDDTVKIAEGTVVMHRAVIQASALVGDHVIINTGAIVEHECYLADFVHVGPGAVLCGNVSIGECSLIGAGSVVAPNLKIGRNCIVGAGSTIIRDVPDGTVVCGNPGRLIRQL